MEEEKYLSVMDLAAQVGVPRTTINDWLSKYSQFITSIQQGRRKVYPSSTVTILKEIGSLRSSGLSFAEIEKTLALSHPVQAVPATEELPLNIPPSGTEKSGEKVQETSQTVPSGKEESPVQKENNIQEEEEEKVLSNGNALQILPATKDDFAILVNSMAHLSTKMMEEKKEHKKHLYLLSTVFTFIFIVLSTASLVLYLHCKDLVLSGKALEEKNKNTSEKLAVSEEKVHNLQNEKTHILSNMEKLQQDLARQRKDFAKTIDNVLSKNEAAIAKERERFASERLSYLKKLEEAGKEMSEAKKRVWEADKRAREAQKQTVKIQKQMEEAKKVLEEKKKKENSVKHPNSVVPEKKEAGTKTPPAENKEKTK